MSNTSSNATSPSTSSRPSTSSFGSSMVKSGSNRSIFRDNRTHLTRSRQNTVGMDFFGEDLSNRNIGSDYQEIQIRTLTAWVNAQLKTVNSSITNIKQDLRDGKKLLMLLSVVASEPAPKPERMNMRIHQLANVAQALAFLERQVGHENMPDIGNEAIVNGDDKKTLALIFFIMLKYQIQLILTEHGEDYLQSLSELSEIENGTKSQSIDFNLSAPSTPLPLASSKKIGGSQHSISDKHNTTSSSADAKMALLYWVRIQLEDYISANIIPSIQDFSRSWRTGVAFCLLIHRHNPTYIPDLFSQHLYHPQQLVEKQSWYQLLRTAFDLAYQQMGIEPYLQPEDLVDVDYPHEPSVMMYVSEYYRVMSTFQKSEPLKEKRARAAIRKAAIIIATGGISLEPESLTQPDSPTQPEPLPEPTPKQSQPVFDQLKPELKADLNTKLMLQLTGHLPQGVHPTLDQLLTLHHSILSYIKRNTQTMDDIPETFESSASLADYREALDVMEEQNEQESIHLTMAKQAHDQLIVPPELAEPTLIRLTPLQRTQVIKLYTGLESEWSRYLDLLKTTQQDLIRIEHALIDTEDLIETYRVEADQVSQRLERFRLDLVELDPVQAWPDPSYLDRVDRFLGRFGSFELEWAGWFGRALPGPVGRAVSDIRQSLMSNHEACAGRVAMLRRAREGFRQDLETVQALTRIESDLETIQGLMDETRRATTDQAISDLEDRLGSVRDDLYQLKSVSHPAVRDRLEKVQARFETVHAWVDQVRVWFVEAERIRGWIEERIGVLEGLGLVEVLAADFDPAQWASRLDRLLRQHESFKAEVERFDQDDMKRLRAHVRELTADLSPADASTIEITLETLTTLDRLIQLLNARSNNMELLRIRIEWDGLIEAAVVWCRLKEAEILEFISGKARWSNDLVQVDSVIQTLVSIENSVADFDKGDFSLVLDAYQDMEALAGASLPLESRQEALEWTFERVMKQSALARKVVEQFLVATEVRLQFRKLKTEGQKLKLAMAQEGDFEGRVQSFKESALNWVTVSVKRVPYPEVPQEIKELEENNRVANQTIAEWLQEDATVLVELTKDLEDALATRRQDLSLQQRANLVYEDVLRIYGWLDERLRAIEKFDATVCEGSDLISLDLAFLQRLEKDHERIKSKLEQLEENDLKQMFEKIGEIGLELDETNSSSIDRDGLDAGVENVNNAIAELKAALNRRQCEIEVLKKRMVWESQWEEAHLAILDLAHRIWDFDARFAQYDVEGLNGQRKSRASSSASQNSPSPSQDGSSIANESIFDHKEILKDDAYAELLEQLEGLKQQLPIFSSPESFEELKSAFEMYLQSKNPTDPTQHIPQHITLKQSAIHTEYQQLEELLGYVTDVMKQQEDISQFLHKTRSIQVEVDSIQTSAHTFKRESSSSSTTTSTTTFATQSSIPTHLTTESEKEVIEQIAFIQSKIDLVYRIGASIEYFPACHLFETSQPQTLINSEEYNAQIKTIVCHNLEALEGLKETVEGVLTTYKDMDQMRSALLECQKEARDIQTIIDRSAHIIKQHHLDVTATSSTPPELIAVSQAEITKLSNELDQLESDRISPLQERLQHLVELNTKNSAFEDTQDTCDHLSEGVTRSLMFIRQSILTETLSLEISEKRQRWETKMKEGQTTMDAMHHQLQQYVLKKNKCVAQQDALTTSQVDELVQEQADIQQKYQYFKDHTMTLLETDFDEIKSLFIKLPLTKSVPIHVEEPMDSLKRLLSKLGDSLVWRSKELEYIQQRSGLENSIKEAILDLEHQRKEISSFTEEKGRWNSNDDIRDVNKESIRESENQLKEANERFQYYCTSVLATIKSNYQQLQETSDSLKPGFMSEIHAKKIELLTQVEKNVEADIKFAHDSIIQRKQVTEFVENATKLEKQAEVIRELFLSSTPLSEAASLECVTKLDDFTRKVNDIEKAAETNISVPKRLNDNEISMPTKVRDKTMNSVVQDIITTRVARLNELVESLSSLLKSQEVFTRLQYMLKTFKQQITVCESWIQSRRDILERNVHVLDDSNLSLDVNCLRDAVSEADSIQTAMNGHDNNFTQLCKHREKYIEVFDEQNLLTDIEKEDKMAEYDDVCDDFDRVNQEWEGLLEETKEVSNALTSALLPAELNFRIKNLLTSFNSLLDEITSVDEDTVTDSQLSEWQKNIDFLESKEYDRLHSEMLDYKHSIDADMTKSLMRKLDEAGDTVLQIRALLTRLYDSINASRLRKTHAENSELFYKSAEALKSLVDEIQLGKFSVVTDKESLEERNNQYKELTIAHKQLKENVLECQGFYDDSCSYHTGLRVQDAITLESEKVQEVVESVWESVQNKNAELSAFVTRNSKWIDGCSELDKIFASFQAIDADVSKAISSKPSSNLSSSKIQKYEKQLLVICLSQEELETSVKNSNDLSKDEMNLGPFLLRSENIRDFGKTIQFKIDEKKMEKERAALFEVFKNEISKITKICEDQTGFIRQQSNANPDLKKIETINNIANAYSAALSHIQEKYRESKHKYDGIISDQANKLIKTYRHPEQEVNSQKSELEKALKELRSALKTETDYITSLKQLSYLMKFDREVTRLITDLKATISRSFNGNKHTTKVTRARNVPELKDFMQRYESVDKSLQEFYQKCSDLKKNLNKRINVTRINTFNKTVDKHKEDMVKRWAEIKSSADDTRERLDGLYKRQTVTLKLSESLKYTDELKERVESLQFSGKNISVEEQELNEIQEEIDITLKNNLVEIDSLLKEINNNHAIMSNNSVSENTLKTQREKLSTAIEELAQLVEYRRVQAHTEGSITEFLGIIDQIDSEILSLSKVIEEASPQNASFDGLKFIKSDLQQLLKNLVSIFKQNETVIEDLLEKAKTESHKQFLDDNEKVAKRLNKTIKDWSATKGSVLSREKELQTCIKELNHEFFTKLAMAKTTPRERRRRNDRTKPIIQTPVPSISRPPSNFRSSTVSTELKMASNSTKRSKSPSQSAKMKKTKYVPDPKSELDVHLGLIVNDSPYKMKVQKVQGEAGKYWFGDEHPRLVYCRILPSKMVMVRIGGGWQELSKFMKDHGHSDGLATKSKAGETQYLTVNTFNDPVDESPSFSVTTRSGSPMGPVVGTPIIRRGSGVSSSLTNRSSNSSNGHLEGDKFIQTDEDGNQVSLKMVKADKSSKKNSFK